VFPVTVPLGIANALSHRRLFTAMAQVGIAIAHDRRLSDWDDAIAVGASAEERGSQKCPRARLWLLIRAAR
jgi:hypothetical protein